MYFHFRITRLSVARSQKRLLLLDKKIRNTKKLRKYIFKNINVPVHVSMVKRRKEILEGLRNGFSLKFNSFPVLFFLKLPLYLLRTSKI